MAVSASATNIFPHGAADEPLLHGGDLSAARLKFPDAPEPFLDLSTGINPVPYPVPSLADEVFARLPDVAAMAGLAAAAATFYGAPSPAHVVAAPGTQSFCCRLSAVWFGPAALLFFRPPTTSMPVVRRLPVIASPRPAILPRLEKPIWLSSPVPTIRTEGLSSATSYWRSPQNFARVAASSSSIKHSWMSGRRSRVLAVRHFATSSCCARSDKFFGLAGLRLGFALLDPQLALRLSTLLGPWPVSGPALAIGTKALADTPWIEQTRHHLAQAAERLDAVLRRTRLEVIGGTSLFRLVHTPAAAALFRHLGQAGILVRIFPDNPGWLRFGLPADETSWRRLEISLGSFRISG